MIVVYKDKAGVDTMTPVPYQDEAELQLVLKEHPELLQDTGGARLYCIGC